MSSHFPQRLKSARLMKGYSLQDVIDNMDIELSRQSLYKYEKGLMQPEATALHAISKVLGVSPEYFFRSTKVKLGEVEFRKLKRLSKKDETRIKEQCREYLERYLELEEILGVAEDFVNPLEDLKPVANYDDVHEAAKQLRKAWNLGLDPLYNIAELLEDQHIKVVEIQADGAFDGLQTWVNDRIPVVAYNKTNLAKPDRVRFTLLHELAHLLLDFEPMAERSMEKLCHQFAGAMLLPEETLRNELGDHRKKFIFQELGQIKKQYGISMQAIVMRAEACGIVSQSAMKSFFFLVHRMGWKNHEPYDYKGEEQSHRFEQLLYRALAEELISMSKAASLKNLKLAAFQKEFNTF